MVGQFLESRGELEVEWRFDDFLSLSQKVDECIHSPEFQFSGTSWYLRVYPNGQRQHHSERWIGLYLVWGDSGSPVSLDYTMCLKTPGGEKAEVLNISQVFDKKDVGRGTSKFLARSVLQERKRGIFTIFCCLKHDNPENVVRTEELSRDLERLMLSQNDSDVTIKVKEKEFRLHRSILGVRTPVFSAMFQHDMKEKTTGTVSIDDCEADTFRTFAQYIYTGKVEDLSSDNVLALFAVADKYQVEQLRKDCFRFMRNSFSVDSFFDFITLALKYDEKELIEAAQDFFADNMKEIISLEEWITFMGKESKQANELIKKSLR